MTRLRERAPRSEETAFCRDLLPRVRAFAWRRTRNAALAEDVAQEVVVVVLEAARGGRVEHLSRLGSFVLGVANNTVIAWQRGERRRHALLEQFGPALAGVAHLEEQCVDRARVEECLGKLSRRAQAVLALSFYAERSADEIATELGVQPGNVRVMRHRALAQLHRCMGGAAP